MDAAIEQELRELIELGEHKCTYDIKTGNRFTSAFKKMFGEEVCGTCPGSIREAFRRIEQLFTKDRIFIPMSDRKYQMTNVVLSVMKPIPGVPQHVTKDNLTDEIAEALLKENPEHFGKWITPVTDASTEGNSFSIEGNDLLNDDQKANLKTAEQIFTTNTVKDIQGKLTALKIPFEPNAKKRDLAILLATEENKPSKAPE